MIRTNGSQHNMVSIKRYLLDKAAEKTVEKIGGRAGDKPGETALRQAIRLLVGKIAASAVEGDLTELDEFRKEIGSIESALTLDLPAENLLVLVGAATKALEAYNQRITRSIGKRGSDFQSIFRMLQDGIEKIAGGDAESALRLQMIREELELGTGYSDLHSLKRHLGACLASLREEIEREKKASSSLIAKLQMEIEGLREPGPKLVIRKLDAATGLLRQQDCLSAMQEAIDSGTRHYAVAMVVNRVQPINARFGREAGDSMLRRFKEHVQSQLSPYDLLFRWIGPAMVAILERPEALDPVRMQVKRMLESRIEENYVVGGRSVLIPISAAWAVFMLGTTPEAVEKQIEAFVASQGCRDFV